MAKIRDLLAEGPSFSFEFFPPKTPEGEANLDKTVAELAELHPTFVSLTYGALGSTRSTTRDTVIAINRDQDFPAMAHLTCVGHDRAEVVELLGQYDEAGVENILALGGDPPADGSDPGGEFAYASELVEVVREAGDFCIGVAAHPEGHPRSPDMESDRRHLAAKLELADFANTQFAFSPEPYLRLIDELAALGCDKPVIPGVMLFTTVSGVRRMSGINATTIPDAMQEALDRAEDDPDAVRELAVDLATDLAGELLDQGVPGLHIYTLNRSGAAQQLWENLDLGSRR